MDLIDLADEELPAARATVEQAKEAALTAQMELDKHQQWLGQHQELYTEAVRGCERRRAIPGDTRRRYSDQIAASLDAVIGEMQGRIIGAYLPFRGEPDLRVFMERV